LGRFECCCFSFLINSVLRFNADSDVAAAVSVAAVATAAVAVPVEEKEDVDELLKFCSET
jgi:hypothetical protein